MLPKWMILKKCVDNVLVFRFRQLNFMTRVCHLEETWEFILQKNLLGYCCQRNDSKFAETGALSQKKRKE